MPIYIFILSLSVLFRIRNVSNNICRENQNTHFIFNNFFRKSCLFSYNVEKFCRVGQPKMIWRMRIICWITKFSHTHTHKHTHSQYVIFFAFPLQQWFTNSHRSYVIRTLPVLCILLVIINIFLLGSGKNTATNRILYETCM